MSAISISGQTPIRHRMKELTENMQEYETYKTRKAEHDKYQQDYKAQMPWKKKAYEQERGYIVHLYQQSKDYIDSVKNKEGKIPIHSWQKEHAKLTAELRELDRDYKHLKTEVDKVNKIRADVYNILRKEQQREQPIRTQGKER